jgi:signal transduction histidine kinase/DNA-binding response OmpR family regulator
MKPSRNVTKSWAVSTAGIILIYGVLLLFEALFFSGDLRNSLLAVLSSLPVLVAVLAVYFFFSGSRYMPLFIAVLMSTLFLFIATHIEQMGFYFVFLLLIVATLSTLKNYRVLLYYLIMVFLINLFAVVFIVGRLEWLNHFRFIMDFVMFFYGAVLVLLLTYRVAQKEGLSERALAAFSSLLRSTPSMLIVTDKNGRVLYLSDEMAKFVHYPNKNFAIGQPLIDLIGDMGLKMMFSDMLDANGLYDTIKELVIEGKTRYLRIVSDKLTNEVEGAFIDITDITPTIEAQIAAEDANKSKSNFLTTMSHEIRTPMNAIIGVSEIELERETHSPQTRESLDIIKNSGKTLLGIINDILDLSKIETGKFELVPVRYDTPSLINDTARLNAMRIGEKPLEFVIKVADTLPAWLYGDELRIKQVLNNILSNAIKYTQEGTVTFEVDSIKEDENCVLVFTIRDTGQGMTEKQLETLYDKYSMFNQETNRATEGTGLGMNITKNLVEMMKGKIEVQSQSGVGTVFNIYIPQQLTDNTTIGADVAAGLIQFKLTHREQRKKLVREPMPYGKVLIVDDVDANIFVAKGLMKPYGLTIETVESGFLALDKILDGNVYDIIFMDHMMPEMDGIETTRRIRETEYNRAIIALTANAVVGQREMFLANGFDDFISKPIDIRQLDFILNTFIRDKQPLYVLEAAKKTTSLEQTATEDTEENKVLTQLKTIEGLEAESALEAMSGLPDVYIDTVKLTARLLPERIERMNAFIVEDIKKFTIEVHGLKSVLKNIGAISLGIQASELEFAALDNQTNYCETHYPTFREGLSALQISLNAVFSNLKQAEGENVDPAALGLLLTQVKTAAENYDRDTALELLTPTANVNYGTETDTLIQAIITALDSFDCETALGHISTLEHILNKT